jgi:opacity protein-like surface antigen
VGNGTTVSSLFNTDANYAIKEWLRVGVMYEWHEHTINLDGPKFGNLTINTLLSTVEFRVPRAKLDPHGLTWLTPYASLGFGANLNSFKEHRETGVNTASFPITFAFRMATGVDFPLTDHLAFNTEIAWNRDSGTYQFNGVDASFNASTLNILGGIRLRYVS